MFTDIESSTALTETLGDGAWDDVLRSHDRVLREVIADHGGRVVKHEGDGFFVSLDDPTRAVECALTIQRQLARHRTDHGFAPQVRIGLHAGEATERAGDYFGAAVNATARVMSLAGGGEVLATAETVGGISCSSSPPRRVQVKGFRDPLTVVTVESSAGPAGHSE
jgi:class 3 adenylate cyclase